MKRGFLTTALLVLLSSSLGVLSAGEGPQVQGEIIRLEPTGLADEAVTVSQSDFKYNRLYIFKGAVRPGQKLKFSKSGGEADLRIGERVARVRNVKRDFYAGTEEGGSELRKRGEGFAATRLQWEDGGEAFLTFPVVDFGYRGTYLYYRSGAVVAGDLGDADIRLYDDNLDGQYTTDDTFQTRKGALFGPLAGFIATEGGLYKVEKVARSGMAIAVLRQTEGLCELEVDIDTDDWEIECAFGNDAVTFISDGGKTTFPVPVGSYRVKYGIVYGKKKGDLVALAGILPADMPPTESSPDETRELAIGEPLNLRLKAKRKGSKVTISPSDLDVHGRGGEQYVGFDFARSPEVFVVGKGRPTRLGSFSKG